MRQRARSDLLSRRRTMVLAAIALVGCSRAMEEEPLDASHPVLVDGGPPASAAPESAGEFRGRFAKLWCSGHLNCCKDPTRRHATAPECEAAYDKWCRMRFGDPAYDTCLRFSREKAQALLSTVERAVAACGVAPVWVSIHDGTIPAEGDCSYPYGNIYGKRLCCQGGSVCMAQAYDERTRTVTSRCKAGYKALGEACGPGGDNCGPGLYCSADAQARYCLAKKPDGASCGSGWECTSELCESSACKKIDDQYLYCGKADACVMVTWLRTSDQSTCTLGWRCSGEQLQAACTKVGASWSCACERNAVQERTFVSASICSLSGDELRSAVATGCGWTPVAVP